MSEKGPQLFRPKGRILKFTYSEFSHFKSDNLAKTESLLIFVKRKLSSGPMWILDLLGMFCPESKFGGLQYDISKYRRQWSIHCLGDTNSCGDRNGADPSSTWTFARSGRVAKIVAYMHIITSFLDISTECKHPLFNLNTSLTHWNEMTTGPVNSSSRERSSIKVLYTKYIAVQPSLLFLVLPLLVLIQLLLIPCHTLKS